MGSQNESMPKDIDSAEFLRRMGTVGDDGAAPIVLDVRTPEEFEEARIPGAVLLDIHDPRFVEELEGLDRDRTYLVYCRSGNRSWTACRYMLSIGFSDVFNLGSGVIGWDGPLISGEAETAGAATTDGATEESRDVH